MLKEQTKNLLVLVLVLVASFTYAQRTVSGTVTDANTNEAIIGANVLIKGSGDGTITDLDGMYSLTVPSSGAVTLVFSYTGYKDQEITLGASDIVNVSMEEGLILDEIVIVGYGIQKKSVVTGAISSLKTKDLEKVPNGRVEQSLQGRVAGVTIAQNSGQPGSPSTIRVRGVTTFGNGGNNPLWVIDGVVVDAGAIGFLNQTDIESIEVLKDAASAAIYGTRAATGVILVTTKKGKAGQLNVNYNGFVGTSSPAKVLQLLNASQYATLLNERSVAGGGDILFPNVNLGVGTDWQKEIFNYSAFRHTNELSLSGGNDKSTFYVSAGVQEQDGIVASEISNYQKQNFRINSTHKISKIFTFGQTLGYTHQKSIGIGSIDEYGGVLSSAVNLDPITPVVVTDPVAANAAPYSVNPVIRNSAGQPYGISSLVGQEMRNPQAYIQTRLGAFDWSDDFVGNAYLDAAITKDLSFRTTVGGKKAFWGGQGFTPVFYLSATSRTSQNSYFKAENSVFNWNVENTLTYTKTLGNHNLTVLLGQAAYMENNGGGSSTTMFNLPVNSYEDASFSFDIPQTSRSTGAYDMVRHKVTSLFSRLNYNFKEKYLFTGIIRRDGSTRFGANNKYGVFPSVSMGWVVTNEDFWVPNSLVTLLKIRGGYGVVGNDAIRDFGYLATVAGGFNYTIGNSGIITTGYAPTSLDNPDLKWEETAQTNIGFELELLSSLSVNFDYFKKVTSGILRPITIPGYVGVSESPVSNIADMENSGIEVELGYNKKFGDLTFSANANFATLKNVVTYVAADADFITGDASFQSMGVVTRTAVGQSYNTFYGFRTAGIFQNEAEIQAYRNSSDAMIQPNARPGDFRWEDVNGDGKITNDDKTFLGSNIPKYTYGFTVNLAYKGFDFMAFAQGAGGNKIFQGIRRLDIGNANFQTVAMSRWTGEGTSNTYPRLSSNDPNGNFSNMSDFYLEDGDYLRLKLVQLGYTIPGRVFGSRSSATRVRLYVNAENLLTLTNYTGYDPEIGGGVFGIDKGFYPQARAFMFGAQVQF
ncbi:MAG: TonB-dependent receptor [Lewinellaceae bacterium]|nr:TonB-dependent receptor [Lewinellaceae bacterium]